MFSIARSSLGTVRLITVCLVLFFGNKSFESYYGVKVRELGSRDLRVRIPEESKIDSRVPEPGSWAQLPLNEYLTLTGWGNANHIS